MPVASCFLGGIVRALIGGIERLLGAVGFVAPVGTGGAPTRLGVGQFGSLALEEIVHLSRVFVPTALKVHVGQIQIPVMVGQQVAVAGGKASVSSEQ